MTITFGKPDIKTTLGELVRIHFTGQSSFPQTETKKSEEIRQAFKRGVREGIAALLFLHRGDSLPRFKTVPGIYESDVHGILRHVEGPYKHASGVEKPVIIDETVEQLLLLALDPDLIATDEAVRKERVLAGEEPAVEADREWLDELLEKKRQEAEELIGLLKPIGWEYVNDAPLKKREPYSAVYDGECERCANSGVGACDDAPHPKRQPMLNDYCGGPSVLTEAGLTEQDDA